MEGNKGIPACLKCPSLPDLGLAEKPVPSELLYKLVPSTNIIEKIAFMWTWKIKNFIFSSFYGICKRNAIIKGGGRFLGFIGLWIALTGNEFIELSSPLRGAPSKRRSLRCSIYLSASYGMISIMKSATSGVFFPPFGALQHQKSVQANWIHREAKRIHHSWKVFIRNHLLRHIPPSPQNSCTPYLVHHVPSAFL